MASWLRSISGAGETGLWPKSAAHAASGMPLGATGRAGFGSGDSSKPAGRAHSDPGRQFDAIAATWDAKHGPASARAAEFSTRIRYLRAVCRDLDRPRVLDLGCGTGQTLLHLANVVRSGVGVDISPAMISRAGRSAGASHLHFAVADAADFCATCSKRFDLVLLIGVLEHLSDRTAALAGVARVLRARGHLIVISPHPWNPLCLAKRLWDGGRDAPPTDHPSPLQLRKMAARKGFELSAIRALPYAP